MPVSSATLLVSLTPSVAPWRVTLSGACHSRRWAGTPDLTAFPRDSDQSGQLASTAPGPPGICRNKAVLCHPDLREKGLGC